MVWKQADFLVDTPVLRQCVCVQSLTSGVGWGVTAKEVGRRSNKGTTALHPVVFRDGHRNRTVCRLIPEHSTVYTGQESENAAAETRSVLMDWCKVL